MKEVSVMNIIQKIKHLRHKTYLCIYHHFPIQSNKILIWANSFHAYGDSPKYIAEYLLRNYPKKYDLVWVFEKDSAIPEDMPQDIRIVRFFSVEYLKEISTAKIIICNTRTAPYYFFDKRKEQIYLQTWHSSLRLKMIEGDAPSLPADYIESAKEDSKKIDLLLSGCAFSTDVFRRAFWYDGEIMEGGTPRCDPLLRDNSAIKQKVYHHYGLRSDMKLAIFAPTFRDGKGAQTHDMDFAGLSKALRALDNTEWAIGCRYHPNLKDAPVPDGSIAMTSYPDMQELIAAADFLITDYSSCMFDMAISGKPCMLYVPDIAGYTANERKLYFSLNELPFPITFHMDELYEKIRCFDRDVYQDQVRAFLDSVGNYEDGHASERVADYIEGKCRTQ